MKYYPSNGGQLTGKVLGLAITWLTIRAEEVSPSLCSDHPTMLIQFQNILFFFIVMIVAVVVLDAHELHVKEFIKRYCSVLT